jgi:signal transduction histidine kinase
MRTKRPWRRRNYFIKRDLQGKYMFSFFIFVIIGAILFTLIFSILSENTLTIIYENYNLRIGKTPLILIKEILSAHWIFIFSGGLIVVVIAMFLTHRFAGPMYRFEKSLEEMIKGNFNFSIRLRSGDEVKELADMMNQLLDMLSLNFKEMRHLADEIDKKLTDVTKSFNQTEGDKEIVSTLDNANDMIKKLREILYRFKIKNDQ